MKGIYFMSIIIALFYLCRASASQTCHQSCSECDASGHCLKCHFGWFGHNCHSECQNCWISGCHKDTGICEQCKPGTYKEDCRSLCPKNCRHDQSNEIYCDRNSGTCLDGCKKGWWGDTCENKCSRNCEERRCLQSNGHCTGDCLAGWWGNRCQKQCPAGCKQACTWLHGKCSDGCRKGYWGNKCDKLCELNCLNGVCTQDKGHCDTKCSRDCINCDVSTGLCKYCKSYLYGHSCNRECSLTCKNYECDMNGQCIKGCIDGFKGGTCDQVCPVNCVRCDQYDNSCTQCKIGWKGVRCETASNMQEHHNNSSLAPKLEYVGKSIVLVSCYVVHRAFRYW